MSVSLLQPVAEVPLLFVDVETTGASSAYGDRITEVAVARVINGEVTDRFSTLVNPRRRIAPAVISLTGITPDMVAEAPDFHEVASDLLTFCRDGVLVGHNVSFDLCFLRNELQTAGRDLRESVDLRHTLDTVRIARKRFGRGGNGLQRLAARLGVVVDTAHRALADVLTTAAVFHIMLEPLGGGRMSLMDVLTLQGGPMKSLADAAPCEALPVELEEALSARTAVKMIYLDARNHRTERTIVPLRLGPAGPERSLMAFCTLRQEQRSFKLARIVELQRIAEPA